MKKNLFVLGLIILLSLWSVMGIVQAKDMVIGAMIADFSDQFQVYMMDGMKEAAANHPNIEFTFLDAKYDASLQMSQMENLIVRGADAIVVMAVDTKASVPMVEQAVEAGIPVISVNRVLENQEVAASYVGSEDVEAGEILMQEMANRLGGKGNIAILEGQMGHQPQILRQQGIINILKNYPDIKIVEDQAADWYRDKALATAETWFQSDKEIDAIVCHNDEMAIGALLAAKDAGKADNLLIAGIDATPEALDFVEKDELAFTVFQDAKSQGRRSIETAVKVAKGEEVSKNVIIPFLLVTKDKVDEFRRRYK